MASIHRDGIVLDIFQNEDNGFIVTFFTNRGILKLYAKGLNKIESKNRANLIPGSIVDIEFFSSRLKNKIGRLKTVTTHLFFDLTNKQKNITFLKLKKLFMNFDYPNHLFNLYADYFDKFTPQNANKFLTFFYVQSTTYFGILPIFNRCHLCDSTRNLIDFQASDGGFICGKHNHLFSKTNIELLSYWYLFHNFDKYLAISDYNLDRKIRFEFYHLIKESGHQI